MACFVCLRLLYASESTGGTASLLPPNIFKSQRFFPGLLRLCCRNSFADALANMQSFSTTLLTQCMLDSCLNRRWVRSHRPLRAETYQSVSTLDDMFMEIVRSIREAPTGASHQSAVGEQFENAIASIAQLSKELQNIDDRSISSGCDTTCITNPEWAPRSLLCVMGQANEQHPLCEEDHSRTKSNSSVAASIPSSPMQSSASPELLSTSKRKRYRSATPSTHCHICCRPSRSVQVAICSNIRDGTCRKVICNLCVREYNIGDWENVTAPGTTWKCTHCVDACSTVSRAQCFVYTKTNLKRKLAGVSKRQRTGQNASKIVATAALQAYREPIKSTNRELGVFTPPHAKQYCEWNREGVHGRGICR